MKDENMNYDRAKVFFNKKEPIHLCKKNGIFYNGYIIDIGFDYLIINDFVDGEQLVFFVELNKFITKYKGENGIK